MIDYEITKRRLSLIIPLQAKIREIEKEIDVLQDRIDSLADVTSPGFEEHYGNPIPQDTRMTALISDQWDYEAQAAEIRKEVASLLELADTCPAFVVDHYVTGMSWKELERKYGKSRQLMDYEFKRSIIE